MPAKIKQGRYIDGEGVQQDVVFIGAEKAIFDGEGNRLDEKLESRSKASGLTVEDTEGILGVPEANVNFQALVDAVASKIMNELVTDSALTSKLADYVTKAMLSNSQVNDQNMVPTSALAYAMNQAITENADAITQLNGNFSEDVSTSILSLYPELVPSTDYTGYIAIIRSNYILKLNGYMVITASGIKKITSMKTADGTSRLYLLGVMPGNPFDIASSANPQQGVYLGAYWVKPIRADSTLEAITHATLYMVYNTSSQRTEVWGGLAFADAESGNLKSNYSAVEILPALFYFRPGSAFEPSV